MLQRLPVFCNGAVPDDGAHALAGSAVQGGDDAMGHATADARRVPPCLLRVHLVGCRTLTTGYGQGGA